MKITGTLPKLKARKFLRHLKKEHPKYSKTFKLSNKGQANIMINLLFFVMAVAVMVMFISPLKSFIDIAQQSDSLNCKDYVYNGQPSHVLSFNQTMNNNQSGSPLACAGIKLYLPYILLTFLIAGVARLLYGQAQEMIVGGPSAYGG